MDIDLALDLGDQADDQLAERFIAHLGLPAGDEEVRDIAAMLLAAVELARRTSHGALLADAVRFAHQRLVVRGLTDGGCSDIGAALESAALPILGPEDRDLLHSILSRVAQENPGTTAPEEPTVLDPRAVHYVELLLRGDRKAAVALTRQCVIDGMSIDEILLDVLEPAQRDVGRRWALGEISVAQEHFCTAVTQFVMTDLYPALFTGEDSDRRLMAVHVPGSTHHVGLRMVVDVLECRDWSTTYLVEDLTVESLPGLVAEDQADLLLVSASMPSQIPQVEAMIRAVRQDPRTHHVKVVVGGRPFLIEPHLVDAVGADAWARDARSAVDVCDALVGSDRARA